MWDYVFMSGLQFRNEGQIWLKRVIAEMGGKDTIVVDDRDADLELAAQSIVSSRLWI